MQKSNLWKSGLIFGVFAAFFYGLGAIEEIILGERVGLSIGFAIVLVVGMALFKAFERRLGEDGRNQN